MADYSQIEARIVAYLANDENAIAIFNDLNGDIHRANASIIFGKPPEEISELERFLSKTSVHAMNYDVGAETLMRGVNKRALDTGIWIDLKMAKKIRQTYLTKFDRVVRWQEATWREVQKTKRLVNPFGRRRIFTGPTSGVGADHTKKEAIAFVPQSTVPDLLNRAILGLREFQMPLFETTLQVHDALMGQGPVGKEAEWLPKIREAMQIPFTVNGHTVTIPVEIKVGTRWSELRKVK
jgi:DNA polymerase-1